MVVEACGHAPIICSQKAARQSSVDISMVSFFYSSQLTLVFN